MSKKTILRASMSLLLESYRCCVDLIIESLGIFKLLILAMQPSLRNPEKEQWSQESNPASGGSGTTPIFLSPNCHTNPVIKQ